jgi:hypothetical protein
MEGKIGKKSQNETRAGALYPNIVLKPRDSVTGITLCKVTIGTLA